MQTIPWRKLLKWFQNARWKVDKYRAYEIANQEKMLKGKLKTREIQRNRKKQLQERNGGGEGNTDEMSDKKKNTQ